MSNVKFPSVSSINDFLPLLSTSPVVVVYIGAQWARVNTVTRNFLIQQAAGAIGSEFVILDERESIAVSDHYNLRTFPITLFFQHGNLVHQHPGGNQATLSRLLRFYTGNGTPTTAASQTSTSSSSSSNASTEEEMLRRAIQESIASAGLPSAHVDPEPSIPINTAVTTSATPTTQSTAQPAVTDSPKRKAKASPKKAEPKNTPSPSTTTTTTPGTSTDGPTSKVVPKKDSIESSTRNAATVEEAAPTASTSETQETPEQDDPTATVAEVDADPQRATSTTVKATAESTADAEPTVTVTDNAPVDETLLAQLLELQIERETAVRVLQRSAAKTVDAAMEWLVTHPDGEGDATDAPQTGKAKSYRCTDTGKVDIISISLPLDLEHSICVPDANDSMYLFSLHRCSEQCWMHSCTLKELGTLISRNVMKRFGTSTFCAVCPSTKVDTW